MKYKADYVKNNGNTEEDKNKRKKSFMYPNPNISSMKIFLILFYK